MHTLLGVLLLLLLLLLLTTAAVPAKAREEESGKGPASYVASGAPIVIRSNASLSVEVNCHRVLSDYDPDVSAGSRVLRSTLNHGDHWSINFPPALDGGPLYCTFRSGMRKWNCDERWLIAEVCMWENSWTITRPGHASFSPLANPACPRCDSKNSIGKNICVWTIQDDGVYVQLWDSEKKEDVQALKHVWRDDNPAFYDPSTPFHFSVTNHFNKTVKIQCDVVSEVIFLESGSGSVRTPTWEYEIDAVMDADTTYFTWTCDFEVLGTELQRGGVGIWSPPPIVNTWIRTPDCIDCAWKLDTEGLWLDDRSCYSAEPVWIKQHGWDSALNATAAEEMEWNPFYYPLKKSSHSHYM